ncbi:MAG: hypothetical protein IMW99_09595 [Firmicutes bacterium]|nr:hypothetical protein [Bacillota bacterium]
MLSTLVSAAYSEFRRQYDARVRFEPARSAALDDAIRSRAARATAEESYAEAVLGGGMGVAGTVDAGPEPGSAPPLAVLPESQARLFAVPSAARARTASSTGQGSTGGPVGPGVGVRGRAVGPSQGESLAGGAGGAPATPSLAYSPQVAPGGTAGGSAGRAGTQGAAQPAKQLSGSAGGGSSPVEPAATGQPETESAGSAQPRQAGSPAASQAENRPPAVAEQAGRAGGEAGKAGGGQGAGSAVAAEAPKAPPVPACLLRLRGLASSGHSWVAILVAPDGKSDVYGTGDVVDGWKILSIGAEGVKVVKDSHVVQLPWEAGM